MIILDTNVISELMRQSPNQAVFEWSLSTSPVSVFTTAVTKAEVFYGIRILPEGKRRADLELAAQTIFTVKLSGRVLPFDAAAADEYPILATKRRAVGKATSQLDAQIAAIALSRGGIIATRNVPDFTDIVLEIIDPWTYRG